MTTPKRAWTKPEIWKLEVTPADIAVLFPNAIERMSDEDLERQRETFRSARRGG